MREFFAYFLRNLAMVTQVLVNNFEIPVQKSDRINSDRLGSLRIMKKNIKVNEIETFTHLKVKIPVKNGPN